MKTIKYILGAILAVMVLVACEDYLLDAAKPIDRPGGDDFYDTPEKVKSGVLGIMDQLYSVYGRQQIMTTYMNRSDNGKRGAEFSSGVGSFSLNRDGAPFNVWGTNFTMVSRANILIKSIEDGFPDYENDELMARYMGDARLFRGLAYMNLVTVFGDLPKLTTQLQDYREAVTVGRRPAQEIWDEIILPDLEFARTHCYTRSQIEALEEIGMPTKGFARLLLAEAYLFNGNYSQAEVEAEAVISSGEYDWVANYEDLFHGTDFLQNNDNHPASIFEVQYNHPERTNDFVRWLPFPLQQAVQMTLPTTNTRPTDTLVFAMLDAGETIRYTITADTGDFDEVDSVYVRCNWWKKYHDENQKGTSIQGSYNMMLMRLADAYHLAAEAEVQQGKIGEAFDHLNVTRQRAGVPDYDPSGVTQDQALDMYLHERRMEFAGEWKRWRDLLRTGKAIEVMSRFIGRQIEEFRLVFPIPQDEIDINPEGMIQNPGY